MILGVKTQQTIHGMFMLCREGINHLTKWPDDLCQETREKNTFRIKESWPETD